jgi:hypothetical protein
MDEPLIRLERGQTAVIGYGSLLSLKSVSKTLGREYDGPFVSCHVEGWRRAWNVSMPNEAFYYVDGDTRVYPRRIVYLNVRAVTGARLNATLFVVDEHELQEMHGREWIYAPVVVTPALRDVRIEGGEAIMYVARDEHVVSDVPNRREAALRASYLGIVKRALDLATPAFREEYVQTTDAVPEELIIDDVLDLDRPSPWAGTSHRPERHFEA